MANIYILVSKKSSKNSTDIGAANIRLKSADSDICFLTDLKFGDLRISAELEIPKYADSDIRIRANFTTDIRVYGYPRIIRNTSNSNAYSIIGNRY